MSSTRDVVSPGIFALDATTTIPPTPIPDVAYRNAALTPDTTEQGWPFAKVVDSANFNEILYRLSYLTTIMDGQGVLGWTNLKNYQLGALVLGSDGVLYRCVSANGPSTTVRDPISEPSYWLPQFLTASNLDTLGGTATDRAVTPASFMNAFTAAGQRLVGMPGFWRIPGGLIIQWGLSPSSIVGTNNTNTVAGTFAIPFPNANLMGLASLVSAEGACSAGYAVGTAAAANITLANLSGSNKTLQAFWIAIGH